MTMQPWADDTRQRARIVQNSLLSVAAAARRANASPELMKVLLDPYRSRLEELYEHEMPLSKLADASDLLLHIHGPAAAGPSPRVTLVTRLLTITRDQITRLAKQFGGLASGMRVPAALDMDFTGVATGSLYIGFSAGESGNPTHRAVSTIAAAGQVIANEQPFASLARHTDDPAARDIALAAVRHLSPSGQMGVKEVDVLGKALPGVSLSLNIETRRRARKIMAQREESIVAEPVTFVGTVRELDLDAYRFEIRNVEGQDDDVRCAHELEEPEVKELMDKRVRVRGTPERGPRGTVRLLWVDEVELLD